MSRIVLRDPRELKDHPAQKTVYGDAANSELIDSVKLRGIIEPLVIQ